MEKQNAIYVRQSVDKVDSISIESQIEYCKREIPKEEFILFKDKGYSGKNTLRPEFQKMLEAVREGKIKKVICYKLDRISRSILDFAKMMEEFTRCKVEFVSSTEKFDTSTPMGRAMLNICIVFAELERETIAQRVRDAYKSRSEKGFYMGGCIPFGFLIKPYIIDGKRTSCYCVVENEAKIIRLIYRLYQKDGVSYGDIMRELNKDINSKENSLWSRDRVSDILKNPVYVRADGQVYDYFIKKGIKVYNSKEEFTGEKGVYLYSDKNNDYAVLAHHEGIVSSKSWLAVRKKADSVLKKEKTKKGKNSWLSGRIKCEKCGYALVIRKSGNENRRYFVCSRKIQTCGCEGVGCINAEKIEKEVLQKVSDKLKKMSDSWYERCIKDINKKYKISTSVLQIKSFANQDCEIKNYILRSLVKRITASKLGFNIEWNDK